MYSKHGDAFSFMSTILKSSSINNMSKGISVFFIQNDNTLSLSNTKNMPSFQSIFCLNIRPLLRSCESLAISTYTEIVEFSDSINNMDFSSTYSGSPVIHTQPNNLGCPSSAKQSSVIQICKEPIIEPTIIPAMINKSTDLIFSPFLTFPILCTLSSSLTSFCISQFFSY